MTRILMFSDHDDGQGTASSLVTSAEHPALPFRLSRDDEGAGPGVLGDCLLGLVRYGDRFDREPPARLPAAQIPLRSLGPGAVTLMWRGQPPTGGTRSDRLACRFDGAMLFGVYRHDGALPETTEATVYAAYRAMLKAAFSAGYPHIYRIWNYLPDINRKIEGLEVYKAFCSGRQQAFEDDPLPTDAAVPAACAIGTRTPGFLLCFLAGKQAAMPLSNPRQVEAYRYPPRYGPRSPVFSRAVVVPQGRSVSLHLSGTASIVGHSTRHPNQVHAQLSETLTNLAALLEQQEIEFADLGANAFFTVYLRREADFALARDGLEQAFPPAVARIFLQGDICRSSLLLEIEGIIVLPAR